MGEVQIHMPPWDLACGQDIFQRMMDQILECCKGVIGIADNVVIYVNDNGDHNWNYTTSHAELENMVLCSMEKSVKSRRTQ